MAGFVWDPISAVNLVLCIVILALGCLGYRKKKNLTALMIGVSFGLFGVSHLFTLLGMKEALTDILIAVRTAAYLIVVYALYKFCCQPGQKKSGK